MGDQKRITENEPDQNPHSRAYAATCSFTKSKTLTLEEERQQVQGFHADKEKQKGKTPVIFTIDLIGDRLDEEKYVSSRKAYLFHPVLSAYHREQEVLIGLAMF